VRPADSRAARHDLVPCESQPQQHQRPPPQDAERRRQASLGGADDVFRAERRAEAPGHREGAGPAGRLVGAGTFLATAD
jgi:hypothetical protein